MRILLKSKAHSKKLQHHNIKFSEWYGKITQLFRVFVYILSLNNTHDEWLLQTKKGYWLQHNNIWNYLLNMGKNKQITNCQRQILAYKSEKYSQFNGEYCGNLQRTNANVIGNNKASREMYTKNVCQPCKLVTPSSSFLLFSDAIYPSTSSALRPSINKTDCEACLVWFVFNLCKSLGRWD